MTLNSSRFFKVGGCRRGSNSWKISYTGKVGNELLLSIQIQICPFPWMGIKGCIRLKKNLRGLKAYILIIDQYLLNIILIIGKFD